jgi:Ca2+-binding EF-hand superfamily protein
VLIDKIIEEVWIRYDKDKNGYLNRKETREFLKKSLSDLHEGEKFSELKFAELFKEIDRNNSGTIS